MKKLIGISLAIIMIVGIGETYFALADTNKSECSNPKLVLAERSENRLVCVYESTAEKLGWKIIKQNELSDATTIPNQTNYWLPIPDDEREDFAQKFATAANISLTGVVNKDGDYKTEPFGWLTIGDSEVSYRSYEMGIDATQTEKFVRDFMDSMGFEYDEENFHYLETPYYRDGPSNERQFYTIKSEYSSVSFEFSHRYEGSLLITFTGWTNNPESIIFTLSEDVAIQKTNDFSKDLDFEDLYCDLQRIEVTFVNKMVIGGIPYYESSIGKCFGDEPELGDVNEVFVYVNSVNEDDIFLKVHNISDE